MSAAEILAHFERQGFRLEADGDRLNVRPASKLTDELRAQIRAHKAEILAALQNEADLAVAEATAERAAILEYDGGMSRTQAEKTADLAEAFYAHLWGEAKQTGCCYAPSGRYCEKGRRLRDKYYGAVS